MTDQMTKADTTTEPVKCEVREAIGTITLNRPDRRNALSSEMLQQLFEKLQTLDNDSSVRVVIIQAAGKVFCAGHDLKEMTHRNEEEFQKLFEQCSETMQLIRRMSKPVIAKVHALATAAGCQLVAACDIAVATPNAAFATPGVKIGLFCTTPMVPLVRAIPAKPAMEMLLTGQPVSAERACELGLINHVLSESEIDEKIQSLCDAIIASSPAVIALGKKAFYDQLSKPEPDAYQSACQTMTKNAIMNDAHEGIHAFLEKRTPHWSDQ